MAALHTRPGRWRRPRSRTGRGTRTPAARGRARTADARGGERAASAFPADRGLQDVPELHRAHVAVVRAAIDRRETGACETDDRDEASGDGRLVLRWNRDAGSGAFDQRGRLAAR